MWIWILHVTDHDSTRTPPPRRAPRRADEATTWAWPVWDPSTGHDTSTCPKKIQSEKLRKSRAVSADGPTAVGTRARGRARRRDARARAREGREGREIFFASSFVVVRRGSIAVRLSRPHRIATHRTGRFDAIAREGSRDADDEARDEARKSADAEFGGGIIE